MINNVGKIILDEGGIISPLFIPETELQGVGLCNPSIFQDKDGKLLVNLRKVDYVLYHSEFSQKFYNYWGCLSYLNPEDDRRLKTTNYIGEIYPNTLTTQDIRKVDTTSLDETPIWSFVGLEDGRLVRWDDKLYLIGVRRDTTTNGQGRMELSQLEGNREVKRHRIQAPPPLENGYLEKNWMPIVDMPFHFVRWTNPTEIVKVDLETNTSELVSKSNSFRPLPREVRGSSQVIPFGNYRIAITHEVDFWYNHSNFKDSQYYHRVVIWDKDWNTVKLSAPFKFMDAQIEFLCGLAFVDNEFLITLGFQDNASYIFKAPTSFLDKLEWEVSTTSDTIKWHDPKVYSQQQDLKIKFPGLESIVRNYSQCYQDLFVLGCLNGKKNGTYLEIGAGDPFFGNNTALLEKLGWDGVSVDLSKDFADRWGIERPHSKFFYGDATTVDLKSLLEAHNLPKQIDYLQLDIDPAHNTFKVLEGIDFNELEFKVITYEHDFYVDQNEDLRKRARDIFYKNGYHLLAANISPDNNSPYEDWWINKKYIEQYNPNIVTDSNKTVLPVEEYMLNL